MKAMVWMSSMGPAALMVGATACAGEGGEFSEIEATVVETCGSCHDQGELPQLIADTTALDDALFTEERFPDAMFPVDLVGLTTEEVRTRENRWPGDENIPVDAAPRKAWVLTELNELVADLQKSPSSVFISRETFDEYNTSPPDALFPEGCETIDRLDGAAEGATDQMPPLYTQPLFELLGREYVELTSGDRASMREYILGTLPEGASTCFFLD